MEVINYMMIYLYFIYKIIFNSIFMAELYLIFLIENNYVIKILSRK